MTRHRSRLLIALGYVILLMASASAVGSVAAVGTKPDVMGFDDISTSCTGGSNYWFQNSYQNLESIGWNDRISRFRATSASAPSQWHEHASYGGNVFNFWANGCDVDLTNNPLFPAKP